MQNDKSLIKERSSSFGFWTHTHNGDRIMLYLKIR